MKTWGPFSLEQNIEAGLAGPFDHDFGWPTESVRGSKNRWEPEPEAVIVTEIKGDYVPTMDLDGNIVYSSEVYMGADCKLLSHFDGVDAAVAYTAETGQVFTFAGTAQIDTDQFEFGISALLLDGNSDYVTLPDSDDWDFGSGDFTIDCWIYLNGKDATQMIVSQDAGGAGNSYWWCGITSANYLYMYFVDSVNGVVGYYVATQTALTTGQWYHVAFERTTTTGKIFLDGVSQTLSVSVAFGANTLPNVAALLNIGDLREGTAYFFNGWIDELRIRKGTAMWTEDFLPPAHPYSTSSDPSGVTVSADYARFGTGSLYFNGTTYLAVEDADDWAFGTGRFEISGYYRFSSLLGDQDFCGQRQDSTNYWYVRKNATTHKLEFKWVEGGVTIVDVVMTDNWSAAADTWYQIVVMRDGGIVDIYIDGVKKAVTNTVSLGGKSLGNMDSYLFIGKSVSYYTGYIDNFRVTRQ